MGLTAGASAPEHLVQEVVLYLKQLGAEQVTALDGVAEDVSFPMPKGLSDPYPEIQIPVHSTDS